MAPATIMMLVILAIALAIIAIVAIGMQGASGQRAPRVRSAMGTAARHLNGEAPPPPGLVNFFEGRTARSADSGIENTGEQPKIS
ncbi:MAG: hypothetical protein AAGC63_07545 [Propionicimonas sp.]|nr:hypothetical protein [Propionicimonas sp.]